MGKSKRTQERYRKQNKDQASLTSHFGFTSTKSAATVNDTVSQPIVTAPRITTTTSGQPQLPETDVLPPSGSCMQSTSILIHPQMQVIWMIHQVLLMCKRLVRMSEMRSKRRDLMSRKITSPILRKPFKDQNVPLKIGPNFENKSRLTWRRTARVCHYQKLTNTL